MQPRGVYGASASKISLTEPTPASLRWASKTLRAARRRSARRPDARAARHRRTDQSATARPCPGGTRRHGLADRRSTSAGNSDDRAQAFAVRTGSTAGRWTASSTGRQRRSSRIGCGSEIASSWFGRQAGVVARLAVDDIVQVPPCFVPEAAVEGRRASARPARSTDAPLRRHVSARIHPSSRQSAL